MNAFASSSGRRKLSMAIALFALSFSWLGNPDLADAHRFGFRGGFRGNFGRSFTRGRGFSGRRFGSFRRFGFRGFRGFGRSRFNSLAFRSRRFGFGGFNRFGRFNRFGVRSFGNRFSTFRPRYSTFAFNHFPVRRIHNDFGKFSTPVCYSPRTYSKPIYKPAVHVGSKGWSHLAGQRFADARTSFVSEIAESQTPETARVGFALAAAGNGELDKGVWAMRRAFEKSSEKVSAMMLDDDQRESVEYVTRMYEDRMEAGGHKDDDAFMLTALYQMQGDPEMAMMAADHMPADSMDVAAKKLKALVEQEMSSIPMTSSEAWDLLAAGNSKSAVDAFITEINNDQNSGPAKVGYALAIADQGDLDRGTWAMRRAFSVDPEGTSDMMISGKVRKMVERVTGMYAKAAEDSGMSNDNAYMLANLYLLQGDVEGAKTMIAQSPYDPACSATKMIDEELTSQVKMADKAKEMMKLNKEFIDQGPELQEQPSLELRGPILPESEAQAPNESPSAGNLDGFIEYGPVLPPGFGKPKIELDKRNADEYEF